MSFSGPRGAEAWEQLAREIGAEFVDHGGYTFKVSAKVKKWQILLDVLERGEQAGMTYRRAGTGTPYTRILGRYLSKDTFTFMVYNKGSFGELDKLWRKVMFRLVVMFLGTREVLRSLGIREQEKHFALQDAELRSPEDGRDYVILSNDVHKARSLFTNPRIRQLIHAQPSIYLKCLDTETWFAPSPPGYFRYLYFEERGVIEDVGRLKSLVELFAEILNQLVESGSASEENPDVVV